MLFIILNFLLNGYILACFYLLGFTLAKFIYLSNTYQQNSWMFYLLGYITSGILTLLSFTKFSYWVMCLFIKALPAGVQEVQRIEPLLYEVLHQANRLKHIAIPKITILISERQDPNSQTLGFDSIILTRGLLNSTDDNQLKAILAHELGHLYNKEGALLISLIFGSMATWLLMSLYMLCKWIVGRITKLALQLGNISGIISMITLVLFLPMMTVNWVCIWVFNWVLSFMLCHYDYKADKFASSIGYKNDLISYLDKIALIDPITLTHKLSLLDMVFINRASSLKRINKLLAN